MLSSLFTLGVLLILSAIAVDPPSQLPYNSRPCFTSSTTTDALLTNYCRPSYLIIGAGKAGTSSLYNYLLDHPDVLPADSKQTHYWKYDHKENSVKSLKKYFAHFPRSWEFNLEPDGTTTKVVGESSPGYLTDEKAASYIKREMPGVKIITVIRDPINRAMSSYRYNYLQMIGADTRQPTGRQSRRRKNGKEKDPASTNHYSHLEAIMSDTGEIISSSTSITPNHVTFSEFVRAEMAFLRSCASADTKDIMKSCLFDPSTLDAQWENITKTTALGSPRELKTHSSYLVRSMLGRGFYQNQLESWEKQHEVKVVCVEHLTKASGGEVLADVADFIGLTDFDFSGTLNEKGIYNYGSNTGYGKSTTWDEFERKKRAGGGGVDESLRRELIEFYMSFGEWDHFAARCGWSSA